MKKETEEIIREFLSGRKSAEEAYNELMALGADLSKEERYKKFCEELSQEIDPKLEALDRLMRNSLKSYSKPFGG